MKVQTKSRAHEPFLRMKCLEFDSCLQINAIFIEGLKILIFVSFNQPNTILAQFILIHLII